VTHNRDATFHKPSYFLGYGYTSLKLNRLGASLLNKAGGIPQSLFHTEVVGHKWHITDYHRLLGAPYHGFGMV